MTKYFCMDCDHIWNDLDQMGCPKCGSKDVISDGETTDQCDLDDFQHGHFEGDLFSHTPKSFGYHQDDSGE